MMKITVTIADSKKLDSGYNAVLNEKEFSDGEEVISFIKNLNDMYIANGLPQLVLITNQERQLMIGIGSETERSMVEFYPAPETAFMAQSDDLLETDDTLCFSFQQETEVLLSDTIPYTMAIEVLAYFLKSAEKLPTITWVQS